MRINKKCMTRFIGSRSCFKSCQNWYKSKIDKAARDVIDNRFWNYFVHSTGHGVGLDIRRTTQLLKRSETYWRKTMVFTIEQVTYQSNLVCVLKIRSSYEKDGAEVMGWSWVYSFFPNIAKAKALLPGLSSTLVAMKAEYAKNVFVKLYRTW